MSEASGFGIELQELRTTAFAGAALIPAFNWVARAPNGRQMLQRTVICGALIVGIVIIDATRQRKQA